MPTSTFSIAVMFWNRRMFWNVRPRPATTMSFGRALRKIAEPARGALVATAAARRRCSERSRAARRSSRSSPTMIDRLGRARDREPGRGDQRRRRRRARATGPARARPASAGRSSSRRGTRSRRPSGRRCPAMMLKNVVLPAPFGPIRLTIELSRDREVDVVDRDQAAEALGDAARRRRIVASSAARTSSPASSSTSPRPGVSPSEPTTSSSASPSSSSSSSAMCSSRRRRWLGNRPSGRNSIISTSATP